MRKFICHNCKKQFIVKNSTWTKAVCPHCQEQNILPADIQPTNSEIFQGGIIVVRFIIALILIIVGVIGLMK